VLVPLAYTGSALALSLAGGTVSGVGIVLLVPLIWTALYHRRWESACVVVAIVAAEIVISLVQSAPDAVIVRRMLLWGALGARCWPWRRTACGTGSAGHTRRPRGCRSRSASSWWSRTATGSPPTCRAVSCSEYSRRA